MSSRLFQSVIHQIRENIERAIGVVDEVGSIIACSELSRVGETMSIPPIEHLLEADQFTVGNFTYKPIAKTGAAPEYCVFVEGLDDQALRYAGILAVSLGSVLQYYDEKFDRSNFIKNVILDNILPGDIYIKSRELRFNSDVLRVCFLIHIIGKSDVNAFDIVQNIFPEKQKDFVINVSETDIALVKEIRPNIENKDLEKLARSVADTLEGEYFTDCVIGIGSTVNNIKDLARSFKDAQVALEVGKVFDNEKHIISYENLGIARLIYQLPKTLCDMFLREVFKKGSIETLDNETLFTIQKFFENNLNVSETSRRLFVHRNTLVYRLEKIKKLTGLDLREFDHAIVFKVALMVKKYLTSSPVKF